VLAINRDNLAEPLPMRNPVEVADVTHAINKLKTSLALHVQNMQELMANVSHEIRSPLMRLLIASTFIEEGLLDAQKHIWNNPSSEKGIDKQELAAKYLYYLKEDLKHMEKIVESTLLSSKLDLQGEENFASLNLSRLCQNAFDAQNMLLADKNLKISAMVDEGITMTANETLLRQMIFNLLDNAFKYCMENSCITAGLSQRDGQVIFYVTNPCPPLGEEKILRLFEPFYRAGKNDRGGVGLGLSLVKKIVTLHGGAVHAEYTGGTLRTEVVFPVQGGVSGA
jgi:two-component system phosphate regulon sensor histidine kinase PhoR